MHCRKHVDMACFWHAGFRLSDFVLLVESWFFNLVCMAGIVAWLAWFCLRPVPHRGQLLLTLYVCYLVFEVIQVLAALYYSNDVRRDALTCLVFPLMPFYQLFLLAVRLVATLEELFLRKSFQDTFAPARTQLATWQW